MPDPSSSFNVTFLCEGEIARFPWQSRLEPMARKLLIEEGFPQNVNVVLCSDEFVREMNKQYRNLDKVTDVLSYEWHEPYLLGEIYIAENQVKKQAPLFGNTYYAELKRVLVHGLFHLCGYDHLTPKDRRKMRLRECGFLGIDPYSERE
ncbi:MAG TPA: rRNA maturation RNase YbeY [Fibrobacteraceae bacterium]|jgi:probable rRNA maturation factor|nr:rRNA maturation RNase YbeY [Fibrobacter sp.]HPW94903.1 rRNA maturation RNase YbeY [Fibrobacteraceae bacterium]